MAAITEREARQVEEANASGKIPVVFIAVSVARAMLLALHLGRMKDEGRLAPAHISLGKLDNVRAAQRVARTARARLGGDGVTLSHPVMRQMANLEAVASYEGTAEIHTLIRVRRSPDAAPSPDRGGPGRAWRGTGQARRPSMTHSVNPQAAERIPCPCWTGARRWSETKLPTCSPSAWPASSS